MKYINNMKYILSNQILDFGKDISETTEVGVTYSDSLYLPVPLSNDQLDFLELNPECSMIEMFNCKLEIVTAPAPLSAEEHRKIIYNTRPMIEWGGELITCDDARDKLSVYLHSGQTEKYSQLNPIWKAARLTVQTENPD